MSARRKNIVMTMALRVQLAQQSICDEKDSFFIATIVGAAKEEATWTVREGMLTFVVPPLRWLEGERPDSSVRRQPSQGESSHDCPKAQARQNYA